MRPEDPSRGAVHVYRWGRSADAGLVYGQVFDREKPLVTAGSLRFCVAGRFGQVSLRFWLLCFPSPGPSQGLRVCWSVSVDSGLLAQIAWACRRGADPGPHPDGLPSVAEHYVDAIAPILIRVWATRRARFLRAKRRF